MGYVLHGGRTGAGDALFDTLMLVLPIAIAAAMLFGPKLLAMRRRALNYDPDSIDAQSIPPTDETPPGRPRHRTSGPSHHGDEPI
jgi:hypothetical protein